MFSHTLVECAPFLGSQRSIVSNVDKLSANEIHLNYVTIDHEFIWYN